MVPLIDLFYEKKEITGWIGIQLWSKNSVLIEKFKKRIEAANKLKSRYEYDAQNWGRELTLAEVKAILSNDEERYDSTLTELHELILVATAKIKRTSKNRAT
jgi:hypothetical protein